MLNNPCHHPETIGSQLTRPAAYPAVAADAGAASARRAVLGVHQGGAGSGGAAAGRVELALAAGAHGAQGFEAVHRARAVGAPLLHVASARRGETDRAVGAPCGSLPQQSPVSRARTTTCPCFASSPVTPPYASSGLCKARPTERLRHGPDIQAHRLPVVYVPLPDLPHTVRPGTCQCTCRWSRRRRSPAGRRSKYRGCRCRRRGSRWCWAGWSRSRRRRGPGKAVGGAYSGLPPDSSSTLDSSSACPSPTYHALATLARASVRAGGAGGAVCQGGVGASTAGADAGGGIADGIGRAGAGRADAGLLGVGATVSGLLRQMQSTCPRRLTKHCPPWHVPVYVPVVQEAPFAKGV
jgi:hypothetical protein